MKGIRIRLKPTLDQERLFWQSAGVSRFIWNLTLDHLTTHYPHLSCGEFRKMVNNHVKQHPEFEWLKTVGQNVIKQAIKDCYDAWYRYLKGEVGRPQFKSRYFSKPSFYVNYESLKSYGYHAQCEKLGRVQLTQPMLKASKYYNPRITYEKDLGWILSYSVEIEDIKKELDGSLGIDLGIKSLAVCSNGMVFDNINHIVEVKRLEKKLKRTQCRLSKKQRHNDEKRPLLECRNYQKLLKQKRRIECRLKHIRENYLHQVSRKVVNLNPKVIVMEKLNIKGMMKNKHLALSIGNISWYTFRRMITYKAEQQGTEVKLVDTFYPSSKTCSNCGHVKENLKLSERVYYCESCGFNIDRDLNAAINLAACA